MQGSRPDLAFEMIDLSTKLKQARVDDLIRAGKNITRMKSGISALKFPVLKAYDQWELVLYTDAAHANLEGTGSVAGHVVFLTDGINSCPLNWNANKIKRIVRSTLAAEMLALQDGIEDAIYLRELITQTMNRQNDSLPIKAYVDNKSVIQALSSTKLVEDKRLRLDIAAIKQSLESGETVGVYWIPGDHQLANCLTKRGASGYQLMKALVRGQLP